MLQSLPPLPITITTIHQAENARISARLAELQTKFMQNVMADEGAWAMDVSLSDLSGCPDTLIAAARSAAEEKSEGKKRPEPGAHVITLMRSLVEPFLTFSDRRDLREKAWRAWTKRGELNADRMNGPIAVEILQLRKVVPPSSIFRAFVDKIPTDSAFHSLPYAVLSCCVTPKYHPLLPC
jgi:peptidyl-dipeptidase Dcp